MAPPALSLCSEVSRPVMTWSLKHTSLQSDIPQPALDGSAGRVRSKSKY